ncbi:MAG: hypothetical protein CO108_20965 [Deltaproteobacteria bacterium CG_4_9_14_3_um_filter_63_12]|nr:MAG: hypothetical protein CO108_20965 [Deltaproteobacteria bacterium CG_4_9_14_3_um_filter_63_12]
MSSCADPAGNDVVEGSGQCAADCYGSCCGGVCVDVSANALNCGACGTACAAGQGCLSGSCVVGCDGGLFDCGAGCVDVVNNGKNCGACGQDCGPSAVCSNGECKNGCEAGLSACAGSCTELRIDAANCGACGTACAAGMNCAIGVCGCAPGLGDCDGDPANGCEANGACACLPNETRPCYTGNPATRGVGACHDGVQTCNPQGSNWSLCGGQVVPQFDACNNGVDDDCDHTIDETPDEDGDGFTSCGGDCCDSLGQGCAADPSKVNPGAYDFVGNALDDDCDGIVDNPPATSCSTNTLTNGVTANDLAKAMDLCQFTNGDPGRWGVISTQLLRADGSGSPENIQVGVLSSLGGGVPAVTSTMAVLSSGTARGKGDPGYIIPGSDDPFGAGISYEGTSEVLAPIMYTAYHNGELQTASGCPAGATLVNDSVLLRLTLRAPTNAQGFSFNFRFFSSEYPIYLCSAFNDFFLALLTSAHTEIPPDHNISFDANGNPVSVNNAFFTTCVAQTCNYAFMGDDQDYDGCPGIAPNMTCSANQCQTSYGACPDGAAALAAYGNSLNEAGATSWLTTQAPVLPGEEITLDLHIWDTSDHILDSLVMLDNFEWLIEPTAVVTFN